MIIVSNFITDTHFEIQKKLKRNIIELKFSRKENVNICKLFHLKKVYQ